MQPTVWKRCLERLEEELSAQQFNTWIRPLQAVQGNREICLLAPNRFVMDWVRDQFMVRIAELVGQYQDSGNAMGVRVEVGSRRIVPLPAEPTVAPAARATPAFCGRLNPDFTFDTHIEGKSNQLARAAAQQVGENPGRAYNPLFIYGGVGLGKTHLMHAAGNLMLARNPDCRVAYVHSERFVADMVKALQHNAINEFKNSIARWTRC